MTTNPAVSISSLTKSYGSKQVLRGLDLKVPTGGVLALLGPNGAGKTTTVEILQGLRRRDGCCCYRASTGYVYRLCYYLFSQIYGRKRGSRYYTGGKACTEQSNS